MKKLLVDFHNFSIRAQLTIWFLLIALIPLAWITFISDELSKTSLLNQVESHLRALVVRQASVMEFFFTEKERNAKSLINESIPPSTEAAFELTLKKFGKNSTEYKTEVSKIGPILERRAETFGFRNIILVSSDGTVVYSMNPNIIEAATNLFNPALPEDKRILKSIFENSKQSLKPEISQLSYVEQDTTPAIFIAVPQVNEHLFVGALLFQIDNSLFYQIIQSFHGLGNTGETLIVTDVNSQLTVFSSLYFDKSIPRIYRIDPQSPFGKFVIASLRSEQLSDSVIDYRGKDTIVVSKKINPEANWVIIAKLDKTELLSTVTNLKYLSWSILAATALIVILIASYVARKISDPILMLTEKTKAMTAGDLSQRIDIPYKNELGDLGTSFNEMASQLNQSINHLDALVAKRTAEVEHKNQQLELTIEELKDTQDRLIHQENLASLGALTAGIAHEIKNPLNFVNNFAELCSQIQKDLAEHIEKISSAIPQEANEEIRQELETLKLNLEKIYKHGKRADSIVFNMLQHSRGAPGEKVKVDLNKLLDEYIDLTYHGMRAKDSSFNVKIERKYDPELPHITVSPQEISRVFLNLLNNAFYSVHQRRKSSNQSYSPLVVVTTEEDEAHLIIKIWDNGLGISETVLPKLFTPFFTTKPTGEGTGLGLSLSYHVIVQGHGGTLTAESKEGEFAEFTITLPI
ncbi:MAG: sensor histidine kinase [Chlamydiales bacterium]